jgi:hypothetical protein
MPKQARKTKQPYGRQPIPTARDQQIAGFVRTIVRREDFEHAVSGMGERQWMAFGTFAERMASLAVRRRSVRELRDGLLAVQLALARTDDQRDVLPVLSLLYRAAELIGADPEQEFARAAEIGSAASAETLTGFTRRSEPDRRIGAMGYVEGKDADGFRFVPTW